MIELDDGDCPSLKHYLKGPFSLAVCNFGASLPASMISFDVTCDRPSKNFEGTQILDPAEEEWVQKTIALLPFADVFGRQILIEAERAERLINQSKVVDAGQARDKRDRALVLTMMSSFERALSKESGGADAHAARKFGKEAVTDSLATSLIATSHFYNVLWDEISRLYEPTVRYIGEQCALGHVSYDDLQRPQLIV